MEKKKEQAPKQGPNKSKKKIDRMEEVTEGTNDQCISELSPQDMALPSTKEEEQISAHTETVFQMPLLDLSSDSPHLLYRDVYSSTDRHAQRFLKGSTWSPDGTCFLTSCEDRVVRLYET